MELYMLCVQRICPHIGPGFSRRSHFMARKGCLSLSDMQQVQAAGRLQPYHPRTNAARLIRMGSLAVLRDARLAWADMIVFRSGLLGVELLQQWGRIIYLTQTSFGNLVLH